VGHPFFLGHGYKSFANRFGERVISLAEYSDPPQGASNEICFGFLGSKEDFEKAFSADASVSGSYGAFSGDARASLSTNYSRSLTTVTVALTKRIVKGVFRIDEYPIDGLAAKTAKSSAKSYVRVYGDERWCRFFGHGCKWKSAGAI
jgi:hypothetical protein